MKAEIITIGDEILIGQIVDTNSAWMAVELNQLGISIAQITSIADTKDHLIEALDRASERANVVLITGGLGPTKDDRTKKVMCEYFDSKMVVHEETLQHVARFFEKRGLALSQLNKDQALVPACCDVLFNASGTAPGMWFEKNETIFISMPGVPSEMKHLMTEQVLPRLIERVGLGAIYHKTILTTGIGESMLAEKIEQWENALPRDLKLAYLPSPGLVRLRLSAFGTDKERLKSLVDLHIHELYKIIPESIFGYDNDTLASVIGEILKTKGMTLASAESCTGGLIAHSITLVPGSSTWFKGSVIAYSNEIKTGVLKVNSDDIENFGAVSESIVKQMADGVRKIMHVDYAVATSGIAGPSGGTNDKPVGTVWVAVSTPTKTFAKRFNFANNRERNILRSSQTALDMLRLHLLS